MYYCRHCQLPSGFAESCQFCSNPITNLFLDERKGKLVKGRKERRTAYYCDGCQVEISPPQFTENNRFTGYCLDCFNREKTQNISSEKRAEPKPRPKHDCQLCGKLTVATWQVCRNCTIDYRNLLKLKISLRQSLTPLDQIFLETT